MDRAAPPEICCAIMDRTKARKRSGSSRMRKGPTWSMRLRMIGSAVRRWAMPAAMRSIRAFMNPEAGCLWLKVLEFVPERLQIRIGGGHHLDLVSLSHRQGSPEPTTGFIQSSKLAGIAGQVIRNGGFLREPID